MHMYRYVTPLPVNANLQSKYITTRIISLQINNRKKNIDTHYVILQHLLDIDGALTMLIVYTLLYICPTFRILNNM